MQDLYAILGAGRNSSNAAIKAAYRELAKQSHPDLHLGDGAAEDRTKEINYAYTILGDPESRAAYDGQLDLAAAREQRTAFVNNAAIAAGIAFFAIFARRGDVYGYADALKPAAFLKQIGAPSGHQPHCNHWGAGNRRSAFRHFAIGGGAAGQRC